MNSKQLRLPMMSVIVFAGVMATASGASAQCDPQQVAKLLASDGEARDLFGYSVSISGDTAVAGAYFDNQRGDYSGSAYVFQKIGNAWTQVAKLFAADGATNDQFAISVSISGEIAIVGAWNDDDRGTDSGSAYIFEKVGDVWTQVAKLLASDGAAGDKFGFSVSISGVTAIVGAHNDDDRGTDSGSAYVFEKVGNVWTQVAKLVASDGAAGDIFGVGASISGGAAIVGAWNDDGARGSAYVFEEAGNVWTQVAKLLASDGVIDDYFGGSVSISGDAAIVGATGDDDRGVNSGSAYIFEKIDNVWTQTAKLVASDGGPSEYFGHVSINGTTAVVGAPWNNRRGYHFGAAYVYRKVGGAWPQQAIIFASDGAEGDQLGPVSLSGDTVIAGVPGDDDNGTNSGSAYVFDLHCGPQLTVVASCPLGGPIQVSWSGATGGGTIVLFYARNTGSFRIPNGNPCAGTSLGLGSNQIQIGYRGAAGQNGSRTLNANAGPVACGGFLQLLDVTTCGTSNVVRVN